MHATSESGDSIVVLNDRGKSVKSWGNEFKGGAHGLHIRGEGGPEYLYLCDTLRGVVVKATLNGETVYTLGYPDQPDAYKPGSDGKKPKYQPDQPGRRGRFERHHVLSGGGRQSGLAYGAHDAILADLAVLA